MTRNILYPPYTVPLSHMQGPTGIALTASASGANFGIGITNLGTTDGTAVLNTAVANNGTVTAKAVLDFAFPANTNEGDTFPVTITAKKVLAASAVATATLALSVREVGASGAFGPELNTTAVQNLGTADADLVFSVNAGSISIGDRIVATLTATIIETATLNASGVISKVKFG